MSFFHDYKRHLVGLLFPVGIIVLAVTLGLFITDHPDPGSLARGIAGPTSWPRYMLYAVIFCAAGLLLQNFVAALRQYRAYGAHPALPDDPVVPADDATSALRRREARLARYGICLVVLYGSFIPVLGFAIATLLFLVLWFLLGGLRRPALISVVSVLGTVGFLYVFVKLALMPLDRGMGSLNDLTVALYRLLRIY